MHALKTLWNRVYDWLTRINNDEKRKIRFLILATVLSLTSIKLLPFTYRMNLLPIGFDFANPYWFQNCSGHENNPYFIAGKVCGDQLDRAMIYPPTIYWSYIWTRGLSFPAAYALWFLLILGGIYYSIRKLPEYSEKATPILLYAALILQFPTIFALERGNNDILVMIVWTLAMLTWMRRWYVVAGAIGALSFMLKLYPSIPLFILGLAFIGIIQREKRWKSLLTSREFKFCFGFLLGFLGLWVLLHQQNLDYFLKILPEWMKNRSERGLTTHSIYSVINGSTLIPLILGTVLVVSWTLIAAKKLEDDPVLVFTGLLALSTYFSGISNDYNLITTYPLIALCWYRSFHGAHKDLYFAYFAMSFIGAIGIRWFWNTPLWNFDGLHVVYQVFWLASFLVIARKPSVVAIN